MSIPLSVESVSVGGVTVGSDLLGWLVLAAFLLGAVLDIARRRDGARYAYAGAWALFAAFWGVVAPHFLFTKASAIEGVLAIVAVPACLYTGYLLWNGRDGLYTLSRAVFLMGVIYYPTQAIPAVRRFLIELVADQTYWGVQLLGYSPGYTNGPEFGYQNMIVFSEFATYIVYACTGIGSMAIFAGLIAAVDAPVRRKVKSFALAIGIIWVLNLFRNVFVAIAAGKGWFQHGAVLDLAALAGVEASHASFWFAHSVLAQTGSVFALVGITWIVVQELPEMLGVLEEVLFVATGSEYDLESALDVEDSAVRADGGE
ncbi:archaeosortase A [Halorubellus sp. PRR65]|uniref:archaeosortase A n=1 Tax=Halorubellus sp. PRR65 TaxID=3098148 RepID=UPI002B25CF17|nr:archaeosortase A [Halorubellus sp. PRR65]